MATCISIFEVFDTDSDGITLKGYQVTVSCVTATQIIGDVYKFYKRLSNAVKFVKSYPDGTIVFLPNGNVITLPNDYFGSGMP